MSPSKLCPRHRAQIATTHRIWPHLTKRDLHRRADDAWMQCPDCQHHAQPVTHLARHREDDPE